MRRQLWLLAALAITASACGSDGPTPTPDRDAGEDAAHVRDHDATDVSPPPDDVGIDVTAVRDTAAEAHGPGETDASPDGSAPVDAMAPGADDAQDGRDAAPADDATVATTDAADADGADGRPPRAPLIRVPLAAQHMVIDRTRQRLYLTVGGDALEHANSVVVLDARDGSVISSTPVGSNPNVLALSDDGSTLWVGIGGELGIKRLDVAGAAPNVGPLHVLPHEPGAFGSPTAAAEMLVLPGSRDSTAVVLLGQGYYATMIFDDGVARPVAANRIGPIPTSLAAGPPGLLFGFNGNDTGFDFFTLKISATGVTQMTFPGLVSDFYTRIIFHAGRVYASSGETVDVTTPEHPVPGIKLPYWGAITGAGPNRLVILDRSKADVFQSGPSRIVVVDTTSQQAIANIDADQKLREWTGRGMRDVVFVGGDTLAVLGRNNAAPLTASSVIILHDPALNAAN
jgi:hypothetical protein